VLLLLSAVVVPVGAHHALAQLLFGRQLLAECHHLFLQKGKRRHLLLNQFLQLLRILCKITSNF
jgi:hypothetical protein